MNTNDIAFQITITGSDSGPVISVTSFCLIAILIVVCTGWAIKKFS